MNDRRHRWICRHRARPATPLPPRFQSASRPLRLFRHRSSRGSFRLSRPPTWRGQAGWQWTSWPNEANGKTRKPYRMLTEKLPRRPRPRGMAAVRRWRLPDLRHARVLPPRLCGGEQCRVLVERAPQLWGARKSRAPKATRRAGSRQIVLRGVLRWIPGLVALAQERSLPSPGTRPTPDRHLAERSQRAKACAFARSPQAQVCIRRPLPSWEILLAVVPRRLLGVVPAHAGTQ